MAAPITACILTRNEAQRLPSCIGSLRAVVAEVVVLDTGSTDGTQQLAASLGASVYAFEWVDDFSAARNAAAAYARQPFIFMVDADEQLVPGSLDPLTSYCLSATSAGRVQRENLISDTESVRELLTRVYPNAPGWRWAGRVHEQLTRDGGPPPVVQTGATLVHSGYSKELIASGEKVERNLRLLQVERQDRPDDAYVLYQIGRTHFTAGNWALAVTALQSAADRLRTDSAAYLPSLLRTLAYAAMNAGDLRLAFSVLETATDLFPDYTDLYFAYGTALLASGDGSHLHEVRQIFEDCVSLGEPDPARYETVAGVGSYRAHHNLGAYYEATGQLDPARDAYRAAADAGYAPAQARLTALM
jgi:glycosyltransferase involved in cell wall biosynthesis